jgi:Bacterial Ig domain
MIAVLVVLGAIIGLPASVRAGVTPTPEPIVLNPDSNIVQHDHVLTADVPVSVLVNDDIPAISPIIGWSASLVPLSGPSNGSVSFDPVGSYIYTPNAGFVGADVFSYTVNPVFATAGVEGAGTLLQTTVTIEVTNELPVPGDDFYSTTQDTVLNVAATGVLANDVSPDLDPFQVNGVALGPTNGTVTLNVDGSFVYTPNPGFVGADSFIYTLIDSFLVSGADVGSAGKIPGGVVTITVGEAPTTATDTPPATSTTEPEATSTVIPVGPTEAPVNPTATNVAPTPTTDTTGGVTDLPDTGTSTGSGKDGTYGAVIAGLLALMLLASGLLFRARFRQRQQ